MQFNCPVPECKGEIEMEQFDGSGTCPVCGIAVEAAHDCVYDQEHGSDCFDYATRKANE